MLFLVVAKLSSYIVVCLLWLDQSMQRKMNEVFLDTEYVIASVSQGQVCVCVLSYVNVMEVSCSSFVSNVCSVYYYSFSHCLD